MGILGSTGWVTAAHLHFDISLNSVRQDPWPLIQGDDMVIPPGTQAVAQGSVPPQAALRSSPAVADNNIIRRTETETN